MRNLAPPPLCQVCPKAKAKTCTAICDRVEAYLNLDAQGSSDGATSFADLPGRIRNALGTDLWGDPRSLDYPRQRRRPAPQAE